MHWRNERRMPKELIDLMSIPGLPNELKDELINAQKEVIQQGAVTYTTKARVEYFFDYYYDQIVLLIKNSSESNES